MKQLLKRVRQISILFLAISIIGCDNDDDTTLPQIISQFVQTKNDATGTVTFINVSENASSYLWDFGDGTTSNEINPIKTFEPGTYTVTLTATNAAGATETFEDTFTIPGETPPVAVGCTGDPEAATGLPLDFEGCETFLSSENFGSGITSEVVENPFQTGINTSDFVLKVDKPTDSDFFAGIQNTFAANFDLTTTNTFKIKVYSTKANVVFRFELALNPQTDPVTGNPAPVFKTIANADEWTEVEVTFEGLPGGPTAYNQLVIKPDNTQADDPITSDGTYYIDDLELIEGSTGGGGFDSGLLTNGDFEDGTTAWINGGVNVVTEGGNSFNLVDVTVAGNPFDVNISQVLDITQGESYILTFDASSDRARTILAGIGLNVDPFTNMSETVNLTTETQTFMLTLSAADFGGPDSRVLFDMGAEVGTVVIDNVSLVLAGSGGGDSEAPVISLNGDATVNLTVGDSYSDAGATANDNVDGDISENITVGGDTVNTGAAGTYTVTYNVSDAAGNAAVQITRTVNVSDGGGTFDDGLLTNGDFEAGADPWIIGVGTDPAPVVTENGNTFYSVNVEVAGNSFDVNVSQKLEIIQDATYTLTFDAWSDRARNIVAGIGLSGGDFSNVNDAVAITTDRQTYTRTFTTTGFGAPDARVLFDLGAEVGLVNIDNVALVLDSTGGGGGECVAETTESLNASDFNLTFMTSNVVVIEDGATYERVANPDFDNAVNSSCQVGKITKLGNNPWDNNQIDLDAKIDFDANAGFKVKVYSAVAGFTVRVKLEEIGNPGNNTELEVSTTATNAWEELTFPFASSASNQFDKIVLFFDLNANNTDTYYFDDLTLYARESGGGGGGGEPGPDGELITNGDFETGTEDGWFFFVNGGTAAIDNTENNGGAFSAKVATNGASNPAIKQERFGVGTVMSGDQLEIKFDSKVEALNIAQGAVINAILFTEPAAEGGAVTTNFLTPVNTAIGSWNTNTFNFTIPNGVDVSGGVSLLLEVVCGGGAGCEGSAFFDNVSVKIVN